MEKFAATLQKCQNKKNSQCLYVDDGAFPFGTREDLQRGMELIHHHFPRFRLKMQIGPPPLHNSSNVWTDQQKARDACCLNHYWANAQPHEPSCGKPNSILFECCVHQLHSDALHQHQRSFGTGPWRCSLHETRSYNKHHCCYGSS